MSFVTILLLLLGLVVLSWGADLLVKGASRLASRFGVSPLVIGLTVVAYGTSSPELVVSVVAGFEGRSEIAVANVIGSNIFNILFILGICACIAPLKVQAQLVRLDVPLMIIASLVFWWFASDGLLGAFDGAILFSALVVYTVWAIRKSRSESKAAREAAAETFDSDQHGSSTVLKELGLVVAGVAMLVLGGQWLVQSAVEIAKALGVSDTVIGLTLIAAGTSLPEVATSVVATIRGERDIAVGNIIGSNIFNILMVVGLAGIVSPGGLVVTDAVLALDIPLMVAVAAVSLPLFFTGYSIDRWEGGLLFGAYVAYTTYLVMAASNHDSLTSYGAALLWFVIPLVALVVTATLVQSFRAKV